MRKVIPIRYNTITTAAKRINGRMERMTSDYIRWKLWSTSMSTLSVITNELALWSEIKASRWTKT